MLMTVNGAQLWRRLLNSEEPDLHLKDVEVLLRAFAMLMSWQTYAPSMVRFLNQFSNRCKELKAERITHLRELFGSFLTATEELPADIFLSKRNRRFNIALIEAVFTAASERAFKENRPLNGRLKAEDIARLEADAEFMAASSRATTQTSNVHKRLERARTLVAPL